MPGVNSSRPVRGHSTAHSLTGPKLRIRNTSRPALLSRRNSTSAFALPFWARAQFEAHLTVTFLGGVSRPHARNWLTRTPPGFLVPSQDTNAQRTETAREMVP